GRPRGVPDLHRGTDRVVAALARLARRETHARDRRLRVDPTGNGAMIGAHRSSQEIGRDHAPVIARRVREARDAGDISGGPQALVAAYATPIVDLEKALGARLDSKAFQAEPVEPGHLPDGHDELLGRELRAVFEGETRGVGAELYPGGKGAQPNVDALLAEHFGEHLGHLGLLAWDQARRPLDERDARAEAGQDLRDLAAHGPTAEHERRLGEIG